MEVYSPLVAAEVVEGLMLVLLVDEVEPGVRMKPALVVL